MQVRSRAKVLPLLVERLVDVWRQASHGACLASSIFTWTAAEERKVVRKLDLNLVGFICLLETLAYVDRANFGNARTAGMQKEVGFSSAQYTLLLQIYFVFYLAFQFLLLGWKVIPPNVYVAVLALGWGTTSMAQAGAKSWGSLMACRAILGIFEAGFIPGVALYFSFFYNRREIGLRYGLFISTAAVAGMYAGSLAYGLVQAHTSIRPWQLLFVVEGVPTILCVPFAWYWIAPAPGKARYLDERQNLISKYRLIAQGNSGRTAGISVAQILQAFKDPIAYLYAAIIFCVNMAFSSLPVFLPTLIEEMGFTSIRAQGLSAACYIPAFIVCITGTYVSDRTGYRGPIFVTLITIGAAGYLILANTETTGVQYFAVFVATAGLYAAVPIVFVSLMNNNADESRRGAGLTIFGTIGQCGPLAGLTLFPSKDGPCFHHGHFSSAGVLLLAAFLAFPLMWYLRRQNKKRDRETARVAAEGGDPASVNSFRFII
ncbi:hypothetical protein JCM10908_001421 [Rhodotorula pacifica]|uniref:uncharacterized protein n=1 Tax=Rhodotorula pacifica TaxID=1495444 RepID=UPI0031828C43